MPPVDRGTAAGRRLIDRFRSGNGIGLERSPDVLRAGAARLVAFRAEDACIVIYVRVGRDRRQQIQFIRTVAAAVAAVRAAADTSDRR